jgi:tRNA(His) 5'-end guanylyltransferase
MKRYEAVWKTRLVPRLPMIVRADGKAFHTLTREMRRPFDEDFVEHMLAVAVALCREIDGAQVAYVQSDEISLLVRDDQTLGTQPWFDKELDKVVSITAGTASAEMSLRLGRPAIFDARAFILPPGEVTNYFIWRQQDATRNSVSMAAHAELARKLGAKEAQELLHGKTWGQQQELLFAHCGINWNDYPAHLKRGACVVSGTEERPGCDGPVARRIWQTDREIPVFTQHRGYIEGLLKEAEHGGF